MNFNIFLIFPVFLLLSCTSLKENDSSNTIYVLGSNHGGMLNEPRYSLRDFISVLYRFRPSVIFTEVRPEYFDAIDGVIHGAPEQSIVYAYAKESGAETVPVDWHNDEYNLENDRDYEKVNAEKKPHSP